MPRLNLMIAPLQRVVHFLLMNCAENDQRKVLLTVAWALGGSTTLNRKVVMNAY